MKKVVISGVVTAALLVCGGVAADEEPTTAPCKLNLDYVIALARAATELNDWVVMRTNRGERDVEKKNQALFGSIQREIESRLSEASSNAPLECKTDTDCPYFFSCSGGHVCTAKSPLPAPPTNVFKGYAIAIAHAFANGKTKDWNECKTEDLVLDVDEILGRMRGMGRPGDCTSDAECAPCRCKMATHSCSCIPD